MKGARQIMENSQNTGPLVSICIPVYNGEKTIRKTISSVISQTYQNLEIVIVDNCSTDSSVKIVQEFKDPRIKLILNDIHLPCAEYNWNRCFQYVHGEFMAIFHADDVYLPQMVERQVETFIRYPLVGSVFIQGNWINEHDDIIKVYKIPHRLKELESLNYQDLLISTLEIGDYLLTSSAMIRTKIYRKLAPFKYEQFGTASDFDMWLRAAEIAPVIILKEQLMNYRMSMMQESYSINRLRVDEADGFIVLDSHLDQNEKNKDRIEISIKTINKYDLLRLRDKLFCARNYLYKHNLNGFNKQMKEISWMNYSLIYFKNPQLFFHPIYSGDIIIHIIKLGIAYISLLIPNTDCRQ
jgi:glycosyltransferase involved in cell wall biosynthesis